ncbi:pilus assembly protein PilM [Candidatus Omnitrophota bacterium]
MSPLKTKQLYSGLEIEPGLVKFVQAQDHPGSRRITKLILKRMPADTQENITAALRDIVSEIKGRVGHLTFCIPRHKVTVRFLRFPSVNEKEVANMVALQSARELPFHKDEIVSDHLITEQSPDGYSKVALVIVQKHVLNRYLDIFKKLNLEPARITFSSESILSWYRLVFKQEQISGSLALIDLNEDDTDIVIFHNRCLDFTRGLTFGINQLRKGGSVKDKLLQEFRRTIEGYQRYEQTRKIERFIFAQSFQVADELTELLKQEFTLIGETISPFKKLNYQKDVFAAQYQSESSLARILGLVLKTDGKRLNLLPAPLREKQSLRLRKKTIARFLSISAAIFLLGALIMIKQFSDKQKRLTYLKREITSTSPAANEIKNMIKNIELIQRRRKISGSSVDILRQLHLLTPEQIAFSVFDYAEEKAQLTLEGSSEEMSLIFQFVNTLEKSDYFKSVELKYVSEKKAKALGAINFKILCSLEK